MVRAYVYGSMHLYVRLCVYGRYPFFFFSTNRAAAPAATMQDKWSLKTYSPKPMRGYVYVYREYNNVMCTILWYYCIRIWIFFFIWILSIIRLSRPIAVESVPRPLLRVMRPPMRSRHSQFSGTRETTFHVRRAVSCRRTCSAQFETAHGDRADGERKRNVTIACKSDDIRSRGYK